jgi:hypothetical protein
MTADSSVMWYLIHQTTWQYQKTLIIMLYGPLLSSKNPVDLKNINKTTRGGGGGVQTKTNNNKQYAH